MDSNFFKNAHPNDEIISFVDNDFVLNFLNDTDTKQPIPSYNCNSYETKLKEKMTPNMYLNNLIAQMSKQQNKGSEKMPLFPRSPCFNEQNNNTNPYNYEPKNEDFKSRLDQKLAKNRESARNSRKRKKIYIEMLESKVAELTTELEVMKKTIEMNSENLNRLSSHTKTISSFQNERSKLLETLSRALSQPSLESSDISLTLDSLRLRYGAVGCERQKLLNFLIKNFYDFLMPTYMRYIFNSVNLNKDIFNDELKEEGLISNLKLNEIQNKEVMKIRKRIGVSFTKVKEGLKLMEEGRNMVGKEVRDLEEILDELRNVITPKQVGKLICESEKLDGMKKFSLPSIFLKEMKDEVDEPEEDLCKSKEEPSFSKKRLIEFV